MKSNFVTASALSALMALPHDLQHIHQKPTPDTTLSTSSPVARPPNFSGVLSPGLSDRCSDPTGDLTGDPPGEMAILTGDPPGEMAILTGVLSSGLSDRCGDLTGWEL